MKADWTIRPRPDVLLPDPVPRAVDYTIVSPDDHLVEPPWMFEGRLPSHLQDRAPRVVEDADGTQGWLFDGELLTQVGMNAVAGVRPERRGMEPARFEEMRPGCWDVDERIRDMDVAGVWASANFPSKVTGFCGRVYSTCSDPELGLAVTRAWNDWFHDEWYAPNPERIIPMGITWLADPEVGAAEIRRNAERGFRAVTLPERPHRIGLPSLFTGYWDPIIEACAETGTVVCLHVGSSGTAELPEGAPYLQLTSTLFPQLSLQACAEWLWSGYPSRHEDLSIVMTEGGIGWVAMLLDRLDSIVDHSGYALGGMGGDLRPSEVLLRNFWFCSILDPSTIDTRHRIGVENIMYEVDYPHGDTFWPDNQEVIARHWGHVPVPELRRMLHQNAAALFRHPLPETCLP